MPLEHVATIEGVPCDVYKSVMQAERHSLYALPEHTDWALKHYASGTFSDGRPMVLVSELKNINYTR